MTKKLPKGRFDCEPITDGLSLRERLGIATPEPTDEELAANGLAAVAEFEREFGPIPDEVIADIQRRWPADS